MNFDYLKGGEQPDIHDVLTDLEDKKIITDFEYSGCLLYTSDAADE